MNLNEVIALDKQYYVNTFGERTPLCFERGDGIKLYTLDGREYIDFFAGIAVNSLGYNYKPLTDALCDQVSKLLHTSGVYYIKNQALLAKMLVDNSCADKVFIANTGTEANEGVIKLVKKHFYNNNMPDKTEFITLKNSFHGRTLAMVAATGQQKYQEPYKPLLDKFIHIEANDCSGLESSISGNTASIILELIQGESGVRPLDVEFVKLARELCDKHNIFLIYDEIQTGIGRCGTLFGYEHYGIEPDAFTLAKGLGGGVPIGAICAKEKLASAWSPGDHGSTFGGNPLAARAALVVLDELINNGVLQNAFESGNYLGEKLAELENKYYSIKECRGAGLMRGIEFTEDIGRDVHKRLLDKGYITGLIGTRILRIVPPLIVEKYDIDGFIAALAECM